MSDIDAVPSSRDVTIGDVIASTINVALKNFTTLFMMSALFYLPGLIFQMMTLPDLSDPTAGVFGANVLGASVVGIISIILQFVLVAAMTSAVFTALQGKKAEFGPSISQGFSRVLPVLGVSLLASLAMVVGLLFLLVPGIFLMIVLAVSVPAVVVERVGVFEAMNRSMDLTRGYRWRILGLFVVVILILIGLTLVFGLVLGLFAVLLGGNLQVAVIVGWLADVIFGIFAAALTAVLYFKLRMAKEGLDLGQIAAIFD